MEIILSFLFILIILVILICLFFIVKETNKKSYKKQKIQLKSSTSVASVPHNLKQKLFRLLLGDRITAQRLITSLRGKYPGEQERWYWEKAIRDLERDRRY